MCEWQGGATNDKGGHAKGGRRRHANGRSTFPALSQGIRSVITDSHEQLNASMIEANVTIAANATGRERVIAIIAAGTTLNILPSLKEVMAEDAKKCVVRNATTKALADSPVSSRLSFADSSWPSLSPPASSV